MNKQREARYLQAQKYVLILWAIVLLAAAGKAFACTAYYTGEYTSGMNCFEGGHEGVRAKHPKSYKET